ncbi:MAG: NUDIX hydrolase [Nanoarchaeota archaeon]
MTKTVSSVLSAVVWRPGKQGGKVLVKESTRGLSLLGSDKIDWSKGLVEGLADRICEQHALLIQPYAINGVYSGVSPSGRFIGVNLNFRAHASVESGAQGLHWIGREEILSGKHNVNTPDLLEALRDLDVGPRAGLGFIVPAAINRFVQGDSGTGKEITASSTVIYNPLTQRVCFVVRRDGLYSNAGGKLENPALLREYLRENVEEVGRDLSGNLRGFIGAFTKRTPRGRFVTSLPAFAVVYDENLSPKEKFVDSGELRGLEWVSVDMLGGIRPDKFYTPDSLASVILGVANYERGEMFAPMDLIRSVEIDSD